MLALLLVAVIPVVQSAVAWEGDRKLFDFLPERYIFYAMELFILVAFMVFGAKGAVQVFWDPDDD